MSAKDMFYPSDAKNSDVEARAFARERLVYNTTEDLLVFLEDAGISKKNLARRLGKSQSYVTQVLSGSRNMTLGSLSDICFALGFNVEIKIPSKQEVEKADQVVGEWTTYESDLFSRNYGALKATSNIIDRQNPEHWTKAA